MNTQEAYDNWSKQYDSNPNKTRDLEAIALRATLKDLSFKNCLEIGCGTGKNTEFLVTKAAHITAIDLSEEMMALAKQKVSAEKVTFKQADITKNWGFANREYDLVTFSLVLEHIEHLEDIFSKVVKVLARGGHIYIGELHPFKQYTGSRARFETESGTQVVTCFNHHISEFTQLAKKFNFEIVDMNEWFDEGHTTTMPRVLTLLLKKNG